MSCIIATLTFLGMWAMGVPYPMVIGLLAAITEWIPIVGPIVGAVPAILLSATVSLSLPIKVIIFYIVIQQIDSHLIMPQVMGPSSACIRSSSSSPCSSAGPSLA